jgi:hypothetical protein
MLARRFEPARGLVFCVGPPPPLHHRLVLPELLLARGETPAQMPLDPRRKVLRIDLSLMLSPLRPMDRTNCSLTIYRESAGGESQRRCFGNGSAGAQRRKKSGSKEP